MKGIRFFDNGGTTFDRYTVVIDNDILTMSSNANCPDGVNQYNLTLKENEKYTPDKDEKEVSFCSLSTSAKMAVIKRLMELTF